MNIKKNKKYTLISSEEHSFLDFYNLFFSKKDVFKNEHLVLLIADELKITSQEILQFLDFSEHKKENGTSFVIVNSTINIDDFPENFYIVPTLQEAEDILEMEAIERELGF